MALAGHPRAMKMAIFTPGPPAARGAATSGHENRAGQQRQRQLFSDEQGLRHEHQKWCLSVAVSYRIEWRDFGIMPSFGETGGAIG